MVAQWASKPINRCRGEGSGLASRESPIQMSRQPTTDTLPDKKNNVIEGIIVLSHNLQNLAQEDFCYLTTIGRVSGRPHTIEIWFALHEQTLYMLSGGRDKSDWVKNALHTPTVQLKINNTTFSGTARLITDAKEDTLARKIVFEKYVPRSSDDLVDWSRTSLPIAVDIAG